MIPLIRKVIRFDAHHRLVWSAVSGAIAFLLLNGRVIPSTQWVAAWDAAGSFYMILAWITIIHANPSVVRQTARLQDSSRTILFILILLATSTSFIAVGFVLGPSKGLPEGERIMHIVLSALAVICSWLLTHTVFALRYAHIFYGEEESGEMKRRTGGLEFPGTEAPDYLDLIYFSFVIGMTCQVSDVQVSGRRMRRYVLLHGLLSFAFNTIILALTVNIIYNLI